MTKTLPGGWRCTGLHDDPAAEQWINYMHRPIRHLTVGWGRSQINLKMNRRGLFKLGLRMCWTAIVGRL